MSLSDFITLFDAAGAVGISAFILLALLKGWLVTGREFYYERQDKEEWKSMALSGTELADRALNVKVMPNSRTRRR